MPPVCCCKDTPDPGPWKAGVDDGADPDMVRKMHAVRDRLSNQMSNEDLIWMCRASAGLDQRTRLGYHIQCCVLHNAASRIELLANGAEAAMVLSDLNLEINGRGNRHEIKSCLSGCHP